MKIRLYIPWHPLRTLKTSLTLPRVPSAIHGGKEARVASEGEVVDRQLPGKTTRRSLTNRIRIVNDNFSRGVTLQ